VNPEAVSNFLNSPDTPDTAKAIVKSVAHSPIAPHLFQAIPSQYGLTLSSREMRISLSLLLGINLEMISNECPGCSKVKNLNMYHAVSCKRYGGLIRRHDMVKDVIAEICHKSRMYCEVEPPQAFLGDKSRPDILIRFGNDGHDLAYDLTIVNPVRDQSSIVATIKDEQDFLRRYDKVKTDKYKTLCEENGASFCPIVMSAFGGIQAASYESGIGFLIYKAKANMKFTSPNWAAPSVSSYWLQRIAIALWAGNARKVVPFLKQEPLQLPC